MHTNLRKKIYIALAAPMVFLCLCFFAAPGFAGKASADLKLPDNKDNQKVIDFCKNHLGSSASKLEKGACFEGYILGLTGKSNGACDNDYKNHPSAIHACKTTGYNAGKNNAAHVHKPKGGGGGGGGGSGGTSDTCGGGSGDSHVDISINIGCRGQGNPISDMAFAIIRVLSAGVGLVVVGSIVVGGIQYTASRGDPQATALAINRIRSSVIALFIFIFGYALLNYIIPGQILK